VGHRGPGGSADLDVVYEVVGETHPKVLAARGEAYRESLVERAQRLGVADRVRFDGRYLTTSHLREVVGPPPTWYCCRTSRENRITSGVLVEAVAAGRAVISTDFPHARELLGRRSRPSRPTPRSGVNSPPPCGGS
jgi:hypothetical protein